MLGCWWVVGCVGLGLCWLFMTMGSMSGWDGQRRSGVQVVGGDVGVDTGDGPSRVGRLRVWILVVVVVAVAGGVAMVGLFGDGGDGSVGTSVAARLLSELDPVLVDATTSGELEGAWDLVELDWGTWLGAVVASDFGFVAVGHDWDGPGLWRSATGEVWEQFADFELPPGVDGSDRGSRWGVFEFQLLEWDDHYIAYGWAEEAAPVWVDGEFGGFVHEFDTGNPNRVVAGEQLVTLALSVPVDTPTASVQFHERWLMSSNGIDWVPISPTGVPQQGVVLVGWADGFYYATTGCGPEECPLPTLYRSSDGVDWQDVKVETPGISEGWFGQVVDVAAVGESLLAVGAINSVGNWDSVMWRSDNGAAWSPAALGEPFRSTTATVELVDANPRYEGTAIISIEGTGYELPEDSVVDTDAGRITIAAINNDSVSVRIGNSSSSLIRSGTTLTLNRTPVVSEIITDQQRVALRGFLVTSVAGHDRLGFMVPAMWLSEDAGATWQLTIIDKHGDAHVESMALAGDHLILTGSTDQGRPAVWHYQWP